MSFDLSLIGFLCPVSKCVRKKAVVHICPFTVHGFFNASVSSLLNSDFSYAGIWALAKAFRLKSNGFKSENGK